MGIGNIAVLCAAVFGAGLGTYIWMQPKKPVLAHQVAVMVPALSPAAQAGQLLFDATCAACHGKNASGGETGPALVHRIYEPNHHSDFSFYFAVKHGVRAHHWRFGNMPAQPDVSTDSVAKIVTYVRELQRANGIR